MNILTENFHRYMPTTLQMILQWDSRIQIVWRCDIYINRITDGVTIGIILSVNPSIIFNLWPGAWLSPPSHFYFFFVHFFYVTNNHPLSNLNTIQPPTTNLATTTLDLSVFVFWFKFYRGFSTLSKQIYLLLFFNLNTILKC